MAARRPDDQDGPRPEAPGILDGLFEPAGDDVAGHGEAQGAEAAGEGERRGLVRGEVDDEEVRPGQREGELLGLHGQEEPPHVEGKPGGRERGPEAGQEVVLLEREPSVGGRVLKNHQYFPKMCPPACGMEINTRRLERNPRLRVLMQAQLESATRSGGGWQVKVRQSPEYVTSACTACGDCSKVCPSKVADPFNLGLALSRLGRADEARSFFQKALENEPGFEPARVELRRLEGR